MYCSTCIKNQLFNVKPKPNSHHAQIQPKSKFVMDTTVFQLATEIETKHILLNLVDLGSKFAYSYLI